MQRQNLDWHLEWCRPYCDDCFQRDVLRRHQTNNLMWHPYCTCEPVKPKNLNKLVWEGRQRFAKERQLKLLCREYASLRPSAMLEKRQQRTRSELRRGINVHLRGTKWTRCGNFGCENELSTTGPRWWVCGNGRCKKECTSLLHDAWRRSKSPDSQQSAEQETV